MNIEKYSEKYEQDIKWLVKCFYDESIKEYGLEIDLNVLEGSIIELKDNMYLLVINGVCEGVLAGREVHAPSSDTKIWQEIMWYVTEKHRKYGVLLLKYVKKILKADGFNAMVMVCMENSKKQKLFNLYQRLGFKPMEHHFINTL